MRVSVDKRRVPTPVGTKVVVVKDGVYLAPDLNANPPSKAGDIITVAGGQYMQGLIDSGLVKPHDHSDLPGMYSAPEPPMPPEAPDGESDGVKAADPSGQVDLDAIMKFGADALGDDDPGGGEAVQADGLAGIPLNERMKASLRAAGLNTAGDIMAAYEADGVDALTSISGIGPTTARRVITWAEAGA